MAKVVKNFKDCVDALIAKIGNKDENDANLAPMIAELKNTKTYRESRTTVGDETDENNKDEALEKFVAVAEAANIEFDEDNDEFGLGEILYEGDEDDIWEEIEIIKEARRLAAKPAQPASVAVEIVSEPANDEGYKAVEVDMEAIL